MKKMAGIAIVSSLVVGGFIAGVAVGKGAADVKFVGADEVKSVELMPGGPTLGALWGDTTKGPFGALMHLKAGFTSPLHTHSGDYEAVEISGTSAHWLKGEDGTKAKKMTPGSYWKMPGGLPHVSSCAAGADCIVYIVQKTKFDFKAVEEPKTTTTTTKAPDKGATTTTTTTKAPDKGATTTTTTTTPKKP
jgi:quercetin dioxygenase-like cupin family protein